METCFAQVSGMAYLARLKRAAFAGSSPALGTCDSGVEGHADCRIMAFLRPSKTPHRLIAYVWSALEAIAVGEDAPH